MDQTSVEENARALLDERTEEGGGGGLLEAISSCRSLSKYESTDFKSISPQLAASLVSASFHIAIGASLAYSAILVPQLEDPASDFKVTVGESSWIASVLVVAVPIGALICGFVMESIGRLNTIKTAAIPGVLGWGLIAAAVNVPMLIAGRLLVGLSAALGSSPAVVYITEIAHPEFRGSFIASCPTLASLGMVVVYLKGWLLDWRTVAWLGIGYTLVPVMLVCIIPESPHWLVSKDRLEEASAALRWIYRFHPQPQHKGQPFWRLQMEALRCDRDAKLAIATPPSLRARVARIFSPAGSKPMLILAGLFMVQQFSGIYITLFYAVTFFAETGCRVDPYLASTLLGVTRLVMSTVNTYLLRRFKRRPLVMVSAAGMAACMVVSATFTLWIKQGQTEHNWVPVASLLLYVVTSMIGMLTIPWTMTAELFPAEIRELAHSVAYSMANLMMFASVQSYRYLDEALGGSHGVQYFFAVVAIIGLVYAWVFLPETHGRKLGDIQLYFEQNTIYLGSSKTIKGGKKRKKKTGNDGRGRPVKLEEGKMGE